MPAIVLVMAVLSVKPVLATNDSAEPVILDFGTGVLYQTYNLDLNFTNNGPESLRVESVVGSCDCIHIMQWSTEVPSQSTGAFHVVFIPNVVGAVDYRVKAVLHGGDVSNMVFSIRGTIERPSSGHAGVDWSLYVDETTAVELVKSPGKVTWIDVRSPELFADGHIPGALNMPLYAVKTKPFLRNRDIVLVDSGFAPLTAEEECRRLRASGYRVHLWYGGMNGWQRWGGAVEGPASASCAVVPVRALVGVVGRPDWLLVAVNGTGPTSLTGVVRVPWQSAAPEKTVQELKTILESRPEIGTILIGGAGEEGCALIRTLALAVPAILFCMEEDWPAAEQFLRNMGGVQPDAPLRVVSSSGFSSAVRPGCGGCGRR